MGFFSLMCVIVMYHMKKSLKTASTNYDNVQIKKTIDFNFPVVMSLIYIKYERVSIQTVL